MDWAWSLGLAIIPALVSGVVCYYLGLSQGRKETEREHIRETVSKEYPPLHKEITHNTDILDNFIEQPYTLINVRYVKLDELYDRGLIGFFQNHHPLLHESLNLFREVIPSGIEKLKHLWIDAVTEIESSWKSYLEKESKALGLDLSEQSIMTYVNGMITHIPPTLLRYTDPSQYLSDVLDGEQEIYYGFSKVFSRLEIDWILPVKYRKEVIRELSRRAKPEIKKLLEHYMELKGKNDKLAKEHVLPLLKKYIGSPIPQ